MKEHLKLVKICEQDKKDVEDIKRRLNKIKKKKNDVDPEVYDKIFSEYNTKLEDANKNLNGNKTKLQEMEKSINQKLKNSEKEYSDLKKKVDEIELRYLAEEFDEDEYKGKLGTNKKEMEALKDFILKAKKVLSGNENADTDTNKVDDIESKVVEEEIPNLKEKIPQPKEEEQKQEAPPVVAQTVSETPSEESINNFDVNLDQTIEDIFGGSLGNEEEAGVETKKEDKIEKVGEKPIPKEDSEASFENFFNESEVGNLIEELKDVTEKEQTTKEEKKEKEKREEKSAVKTGDGESFIEHDTIITVDPNEKAEDKYIECPKCGYKNKPDSWFCEKCGADLMQ